MTGRRFEIDWRKPDYEEVYKERAGTLIRLREEPGALVRLEEYYAENWATFINDWMLTYDPRNLNTGAPTTIPFLLFPRQEEFIQWVYERWRARERGLGEKSRDVGFSWIASACAVCLWRFFPEANIGIGSRKKELVDNGAADRKSLFWKIRFLIENLPIEFIPKEYGKDSKWGVIHNPENGSTISGEIGDNIGMGDRAQPLNARILTPIGWTRMGEIKVGDKVIGQDGYPTRVQGVFPQGKRPIYEVRFSDDTYTECTSDHLWEVTDRKLRKALWRVKTGESKKIRGPSRKVLRLEEMEGKLFHYAGADSREYEYRIPLVKPVFYARQDEPLPLDPYVLGVLLGDGSLSQIDKNSIGLTSADQEIVDLVKKRLPADCEVRSDGQKYGYRIIQPGLEKGRGKTSALKNVFRRLRLAGKTAEDKFIPEIYLRSCASERLDLLRGLIDSDGWISLKGKNGCKVGYTSISFKLAAGAAELVQSLGGVVYWETKPSSRRMFPQERIHNTKQSYTLQIVMPEGMCPAYLSRKAGNYREREKYFPKKAITQIQYVGEKEAQCISVENRDGLYVTDDYILTHNTTIYFVDEADALEHPQAAEVALSQTTDCRIDISATYNVGSVFYNNKRSLPSHQVFEFDWTDDPRKRLNPDIPKEEEPWYQQQLRELDPTVVASQVDRNPNAAIANTFINAELIDGAFEQQVSTIDMPSSVPWCIGVDASGMGNDESVLWARRGRISLPLREGHLFRRIDGIQLAEKVKRLALLLLKTAPIGLVCIERDGPGGSCADQLKYSFLEPVLKAIHTGAKLKDGRHFNVRAYLHAQAKEYLQEEAPYIPKDNVFMTQATGILHESRGGSLLIESKDEYRKRLSGQTSRVAKMAGRSPDRWDAFILTFAPQRGESIKNARPAESPGLVGTTWKPMDAVMGY